MVGLESLYSELIGPEYVGKCDVCVDKTSANRTHSSCDLHTDGARVRSRGSSINSPVVRKYLKFIKNEMKDYKTKGNIQLLPSEVRRICTALLSDRRILLGDYKYGRW